MLSNYFSVMKLINDEAKLLNMIIHPLFLERTIFSLLFSWFLRSTSKSLPWLLGSTQRNLHPGTVTDERHVQNYLL